MWHVLIGFKMPKKTCKTGKKGINLLDGVYTSHDFAQTQHEHAAKILGVNYKLFSHKIVYKNNFYKWWPNHLFHYDAAAGFAQVF